MITYMYHLGDDGEGDTPAEAHVVRRADNSFTIWASGRVNCDGLLIHIEVKLNNYL